MTYDLLPGLTYFLAVLFTVTALGVLGSLAALGWFLGTNRRARVNRQETIPAYYRRILVAH
ncbi:MAG: hypothetical protein U0R80_09775 [Nocardioidaceae bacterium]